MSSSKLVSKIKNNKEATAYKYFEAEVEIEEAEALAEALDTIGDDATANTVRAFIAQYNGEVVQVEDVRLKEGKVVRKPKAKPKAAPASEYYASGTVNVLDMHLDIMGEYEPLKHLNNRFRIKANATRFQQAMYFNKYWHAAIEFYAADDMHGRFTRLLRHKIAALTGIDSAERKKALKGIPTEAEVNAMYEA